MMPPCGIIACMLIRLNPRIPVVWRTPDTLQVGIDAPLAVIETTTPGVERVIAALRAGAPLPVVEYVSEAGGATPAQTEALLAKLGPALEGEPEPPATYRVVVDGDAPTAERISGLLRELGIEVSSGAATPDQTDAADLAVIVGYYALPPERYGRWLRRDTPHLPVVFSDAEIRVGPLVEPGTGPCLSCLELSHIDTDPAWPAMAIQLLARATPPEDIGQQIEVSALVAGWVADRLRSGRAGTGTTAAIIAVATGVVTPREHLPHAGCGCQSLPRIASAPAVTVAAARPTPS